VQQGAIAAELREALEFINPGNTEEYRRLGETVIQQSSDLGQRLAGDSLKRLGVQSTFTTIPLDAVRFQAERFTKSLVNYSNRQAGQISAVVEQGLVQGWGVRKTEQGLKALGVSFKSNAETIARTEIQSAYVNSSMARYEKAGIDDKVIWIATPSDRLCSYCAAKNGLMYRSKDVVFPPHPRCRCTTLPGTGLTAEDAEYYKSYREQTLQELKDAGGKPDNGLTPFEKAAGLTSPPKPVWEPGQPLPKDVGMPQPPPPPPPPPKVTTAKPTLKGDPSWNPHAKTDLTPAQFREYVEARYTQINQNNPSAAHNQTWEEYKANNPSAKKGEYQSAVKDAIRDGGYVPSEGALSGLKLGKPEQAALAENRAALEARGRLIADMDLAINAPILPGGNSSGWSSQMSRADAAKYLEGSYFGTTEFYHGNQRRVTDSVAEEGAKPWLNSRGIYGQGTYFGVDPAIGREYAKAASQGNTVDVGIVTTHIKGQNPYVVSAAELDQLAQSFPGTQSNGSDSATMTAFLRARGYDSVYLTDLGYGVAFDQRQVVTVENQRLTREEVDEIEVDISLSAKDMVADDNASAILLRSRRSTVIEGDPVDEDWLGLGEIDAYNPNGFDDEEDW
jgi:SPP1 gp7 family putative phage head morphogenesis protein